jgi:hypothetical protein
VNETGGLGLNNAALIGLVIAAVGYLVRLTVWDAIKELRTEVKAHGDKLTAIETKVTSSSDAIKDLRESARAQGKRIGDVESFQYAMERSETAVRRARRDMVAEQQSRGVVTQHFDDEDSKT